jgi:hypothetical protein
MLTSGKKAFFSAVLMGLAVFGAPGHALFAAPPAGKTAEALPERCRMQAPERGVCKAIFEVYAFNPETNACEESNYGGCGGIVPFHSPEECKKTCEIGERLRLISIKTDEGSPYVSITIEYPRTWKNPNITINVDGTVAQSRLSGGGSSGAIIMNTYAVAAGGAGLRTIAVTAKVGDTEHRVSTKYYLRIPDLAVLLDRTGDNEALFEPVPLRFFLLQASNPQVRLNGNPIPVITERSSHGSIVSASPEWKPGQNAVVLEATGRDGSSIKKAFSFVYLADANATPRPPASAQNRPFITDNYSWRAVRLTVGDRITIPYGYMGSKSGPFFSASSSDPSLGIREKATSGMPVFLIDKDGWVTASGESIWEITALRPGKATLEFSVKKHFRGTVELEKEIEVTIVSKP